MAVVLQNNQEFGEEQIVFPICGNLAFQLFQKTGQQIIQLLAAVDDSIGLLEQRKILIEKVEILHSIWKQNQPFSLDAVCHSFSVHNIDLTVLT